jgi:hypothetical protein
MTLHFNEVGHLTPEGHELIAATLADYLRSDDRFASASSSSDRSAAERQVEQTPDTTGGAQP